VLKEKRNTESMKHEEGIKGTVIPLFSRLPRLKRLVGLSVPFSFFAVMKSGLAEGIRDFIV
jgi:hypothetical protein